jgi:heptosyltransferase-2
VPGIDAVVTLEAGAGAGGHARALAGGRFDTAILLPNAFRAAWLAWRAGVTNRWGYRADGRGFLLTRGVPKPESGCHQSAYYQQLARALGIESGPGEPCLDVPPPVRVAALDRLTSQGYDGASPVVVIAPGAAYGTAKQWTPAHVAALLTTLIAPLTTAITLAPVTTRAGRPWCVLVGSRGDVDTGRTILAALSSATATRVIDLIGQTTLEMLMGVLSAADVCVSNDSGAMHLAAAAGTRVVGLFGPTDERQTSPIARPGSRAAVLTHPVWCRPCMLRECPIDHSCMTGIAPDLVVEQVRSMM